MYKSCYLGFYKDGEVVIRPVEVAVDDHDIMSCRERGYCLITGKMNTVTDKDGILFVFADSYTDARIAILWHLQEKHKKLLDEATVISGAIRSLRA